MRNQAFILKAPNALQQNDDEKEAILAKARGQAKGKISIRCQ